MVDAGVEQHINVAVSYFRLYTQLTYPRDKYLDGNSFIGSGVIPNAPAEWSEKSHVHIVLQSLKDTIHKQVQSIKGDLKTQSQNEDKNTIQITLLVPENLFSQFVRKYETRSLGHLAFGLTVTIPSADVGAASDPYTSWLQSKVYADTMPVVVNSLRITGPEYVMIE